MWLKISRCKINKLSVICVFSGLRLKSAENPTCHCSQWCTQSNLSSRFSSTLHCTILCSLSSRIYNYNIIFLQTCSIIFLIFKFFFTNLLFDRSFAETPKDLPLVPIRQTHSTLLQGIIITCKLSYVFLLPTCMYMVNVHLACRVSTFFHTNAKSLILFCSGLTTTYLS